MPARESPPAGAWGATHERVAQTLNHHKARGNIGGWYRRGDTGQYVVTINGPGPLPPVTFYGLREVQAFIIGMGTVAYALPRGSTTP